MGVTSLVEDAARLGARGADDVVRASSGWLRRGLADLALLGGAGVVYNAVGAPYLEAVTGRDLPGGGDSAARGADAVGNAAGSAWGTFAASFGAGTARGAAQGLTTGLGLPPGTAQVLLWFFGGLVLWKFIRD